MINAADSAQASAQVRERARVELQQVVTRRWPSIKGFVRAAAAAAGREMRARLKSGPESARTAFFSRNRRRFFSLARGLFSGCGAAELCVMERERVGGDFGRVSAWINGVWPG